MVEPKLGVWWRTAGQWLEHGRKTGQVTRTEEDLVAENAWLIEVMAQTSRWVAWYNQRRLHSGIGHRPPVEVHAEWVNQQRSAGTAAQ